MKRILRVGAVLLLTATASAACGKDKTDDTSTATTEVKTTTTVGSTANGSASSLTLVASGITFDKTSLTAKAGTPLTITLKNEDAFKHNITIEDLKVDKDADGKKSVTTESFTPAAGTYQYHCEYHPDAMKGELVVS